MDETNSRIFLGIKITRSLQDDLDNPAPGTKQYFDGSNNDYLKVIELGADKYIGRYVDDGVPAASISDISRNVCSLVKLITRGRRIEDDEIHLRCC